MSRISVVFLLTFAASWPIVHEIVRDLRLDTDFLEHIGIVENWLAGTGPLPPHFLFHVLIAALASVGLSLELGAVAVVAGSIGATAVVLYEFYFAPPGPDEPRGVDWPRVACTFAACVATAIYAYGFNTVFMGQSSPTIWHNPTGMVLKPLALLSAFCIVRIVQGESTGRLAFVTFGLLLLGLVAKPAFALDFIPVALVLGAIPLLSGAWSGRAALGLHVDSRARLALLVLGIGTGFALWIQAAYILPTRPGVEVRPFLVWSGYTPSIAISLMLGLAFPAAVTAADARTGVPLREIALAWGYVLVGALTFALLAERGLMRTHGNLGWGYQIGLSVLYAFALRSYLAHWRARRRGWAFTLATTLLALCVTSGIYYVYQIVALESYD